MCRKLKTLSKNKYGELYYCNTCKVYHLLFRNIHFILNQKQLNSLKTHIKTIHINYWESLFEGTTVKRRIPVPTCQENLILMFDKLEFDAFKNLFFNPSRSSKVLCAHDVDYHFILN